MSIEINATMKTAALRTDGEDTSILKISFQSLEDADRAVDRLRAVQRYHGQRVRLVIEPLQQEMF